MYWNVAAPFIDKTNLEQEFWLTPYVPGSRHKFNIVPRQEPLPKWHDRKSNVTDFREWLVYWHHGMEVLKGNQVGVITVFPQLPAVVGMQKRLTGKRMPIVAWLFSVGTCYDGMRRSLAQASLKDIDCFIVHTWREWKLYQEWLGIPEDKIEFVPFHENEQNVPVLYPENTTQPFITALGSAHRDFPTLFKAVEKLQLPTIVASGKRALEGLVIPNNVKAPLGISKADCLRLAQEARINIVPLLPKSDVTVAGLVTIVEAMHMGRVVIASRCMGAEDYIKHGETGILVEPESVDDLVQAIEILWNDTELRNRLGKAAQKYAKENFSCEAAGKNLGQVLDKVADRVGMY
jgi:glycosyltransferase involved in cell wall biosynthesis